MSVPEDPPDPDEAVMGALRALLAMVVRAVDGNTEQASFRDVQIVAMAAAGYRASDVALRLRAPSAGIRADVERLAAEGFVGSSSPGDRPDRLRVAPRGERLLAEVGVRHRAEFERVLSRLDDRERDELGDALGAFPITDALAHHDLLTLGMAGADDSANRSVSSEHRPSLGDHGGLTGG